jgi:hypothetical protein
MITRRFASWPLLAAAALTAACATGGKVSDRPSWVEGESAQWPRSRFVVGVGSSDDPDSAADRARGEVARVFSTDISVTTHVEQSESTVSSGGKTAGSFASQVDDKVKTTARQVLEGVDIVARWHDESSRRWYALAALPKAHSLLAVEERLHDLNSEAARYKSELAAEGTPFARARAAAKLKALAKAQADLNAQARVLGETMPSDASPAGPDADKALAALDVVVAVSGDGSDAVQTGVISGLNAAGLTAKRGSTGDKSDLLAEAAVTVISQESGDPRWKRARASASVTLSDSQASKVFSRFELASREDATDPATARTRALTSLSKQTAEKVTASINDYFSNQ